ncbi:hypothetical protein QTP86_008079 [Hemibagrus guttatus]|nr:hypothetical protein QTP86_008079 [Hemibagrus guttatus]
MKCIGGGRQDRAEPEKTAQVDGEVGATSATSEGAESVSATAARHDTEKPVEKPAEVLSIETDPVPGERRAAATDSLHWLLKEPLIHGARLDIAGNALTQTLLTSGVITLGHLVDLAGSELNDADGAAACLRPRSTRTVARLLQKWNSALSPEEKGMLMEYCGGIERPDEEEPFPELTLCPDLEGSTGHFLELNYHLESEAQVGNFKDSLTVSLKTLGISSKSWEELAQDRTAANNGIKEAEAKRGDEAKNKTLNPQAVGVTPITRFQQLVVFRMKLLPLVLLLSSFSSLTLTEVVDSFKQSCPNFFIRNPEKPNGIIIPTIFPGCQYKTICQLWKNKYRFATVYDTVRRIPVYSAYTLSGKEQTIHSHNWKIEPQLEDITKKKEMINSPRTPGSIFNQAVNSDYTENLNIFSSATSSSDSCLFLSDTVSKPYSMAGLTTVLYTFPLILADIF